jgi:predicted nucleic acid-binding protein
MPFVLDASIVGCWAFPDETSAIAAAAYQQISLDHAVVPALWWFEIRSVLLIGEQRGRIEPLGSAEMLANLTSLSIRVDREPDSDAAMALARTHRLTIYDASYLELAQRQEVPLATLDRALAAAARAAAVPLLGEGGA